MYSIKDLMNRYKLTRQGVQYFVNKNLGIINASGSEHAKQTVDGWQFDETAVRIIDKLRGFSQVTILEQVESERIKELENENENLRQLLLIAQSKLIKVQEDLNENQKKLSDSTQKLLVAESQSKDSQVELRLEKEIHSLTKNNWKNLTKNSMNQISNSTKRKTNLAKRKINSKKLKVVG